jgi:ferredoxin
VSVQQQRALWEQQARLSRWLALLLGTVALTGIVLVWRLWQLGWEALAAGMVLGALGWQLLIWAIEALRDRLQWADLPRPLRAGGGAFLIVLLLALALSGFLRIPDFVQPLVLGGFALVILLVAQAARETSRPRAFMEILNDGKVLSLPKGTPLLTGLEEAGYRLITQCGRQGACASCRARVREGTQAWEEKHYGPVLTPRQRREGWVLTCQVPAEHDLVLELFKPLVTRWPTSDQSQHAESVRTVRAALPGLDCEACGYFTCDRYAQAVAQGAAPPTLCLPGGASVRQRLQQLTQGMEGSEVSRRAQSYDPRPTGV